MNLQPMSRTGLTAALIAASLLAPPPARADSTQAWDNLSNVLVFGLGGAAVATTYAKKDRQGGKELVFSLGSTLLATEALKAIVDEPRPDGSGNDGFPSGHTSLAFAAATYFSVRYGNQYPQYVPLAYGAAILTGVSRVQADKHMARDVVAGAALGWGLAHLFTTPQNAEISIVPVQRGARVTYTMHF